MKQNYHSNSKTNIHIRYEISKSKCSIVELSKRYNVGTKTIFKWKNRSEYTDKSSRPHTIEYTLSQKEKAVSCIVRRLTWWSLDDVVEAVFPNELKSKRTAVYRAFVAENINTKPKDIQEKAKTFKEYEPGFIHMDVTYLPKLDEDKKYLFVAVDRATRLAYYKTYDAKTAENAQSFLLECIEFFPFKKLTHLLTDNGLEFTNKLLKSKKGDLCLKPSKVDEVCTEYEIDHRLTKPGTPKTNGMVERINGTIKENTIKTNNYESQTQLQIDLLGFLIKYNLYRRHGGLRKELNVKTPFDAVVKWYELKPELFKETPEKFREKVLSLKLE